MKNLICGIGKSEIHRDTIFIKSYPFKPSIAYPERKFKNKEIEGICIDTLPYFKVRDDLIFITGENKTKLSEFANHNMIRIFKHTWNWDRILEPFLDTEFEEQDKLKTFELLNKNGITQTEVKKIRKEIETQMYKYNFDTMLWEWVNLGLSDVLSAMRVKYNSKKFKDFYHRAITLELRKYHS